MDGPPHPPPPTHLFPSLTKPAVTETEVKMLKMVGFPLNTHQLLFRRTSEEGGESLLSMPKVNPQHHQFKSLWRKMV